MYGHTKELPKLLSINFEQFVDAAVKDDFSAIILFPFKDGFLFQLSNCREEGPNRNRKMPENTITKL